MLDLKSKRWSELHHWFGSADDIPGWLESLDSGTGEISDKWDDICHQVCVSPAAIAAAPYILRYAASAPLEKRSSAFYLLAIIHDQSESVKEDMPMDIVAWYDEIENATQCEAIDTFSEGALSPLDATYLLEAIALLHECRDQAKLISAIHREELCVQCPECDAKLCVWPTKDGGHAVARSNDWEVWSENPEAYGSGVKPSPISHVEDNEELNDSNAYDWLHRLAKSGGYSDLAHSLRCLNGDACCPDCNTQFVLQSTV